VRACTVHVADEPHLSCLTLAVTVGEREVRTIEGLAAADGTLHPMQRAFIEHDAFQCGYCTPGQILSAVACVAQGRAGSDAEVREFMSGNLCRCAAYPQIVAAVRSVAARDRRRSTVRPFEYRQADSIQDALGRPGAFLAGGTTLIDLMKLDVTRPNAVTSIGPLPLRDVEVTDGEVRLGALMSMTAAAEHPVIAERYPALRAALLAGASQQIRNMASMGGNVMQRTRCGYFRDTQFTACNKREPGSGCAALDGLNRKHAVLGGEQTPGPGACVAVHASDAAVALVAYGARLTLQGPDGTRDVPLQDFLLLPGGHPEREHDLRRGELITHLTLPPDHRGDHRLPIER